MLSDEGLAAVLRRLEALTSGIVITSADRRDPDDHRVRLSERYVMWTFEMALKEV
jgi:hypothetical protein